MPGGVEEAPALGPSFAGRARAAFIAGERFLFLFSAAKGLTAKARWFKQHVSR